MVKTIEELELDNKRVILRVDYNVPVKNGKIVDTKKIDSSLKTIDYLIEHNCKIVILSHFGRVKTENDKEINSLKPVYEYIKNLNKYDILFSDTPFGTILDNIVKTLDYRQIVLVENTRFLDIEMTLESGCDTQLSMYWAHLGDVFINDAFGTMHRNHASTAGIAKYLPSGIGFLVQKELKNLNPLINNITHPFVVLMGGAKLDDKIDLINSLCSKADYIILGGGIANTFLKALGYNTGASLVSENSIDNVKELLSKYKDKFILPKDVITSPTYSEEKYELKDITEVTENDVIGDIGSKALENYKKILESARTIFVNGTVGIYEKNQFSNGTREILGIISNLNAIKIVGGGDAASSVKYFNCEDKMSFISTGGGATLSYIGKGNLISLKAIEESNEKNLC